MITKQREKRFPISYLALKLRYMNKTDTESGVEKSLFQFSLLLLIFSAKTQIYINKTHVHKGELKTLYFKFV